MKAIQATIGTSQPIVSEAELNTIFYKIPELYNLHANFLEALKRHSQKWESKIGESFKIMVTSQFFFKVLLLLIRCILLGVQLVLVWSVSK